MIFTVDDILNSSKQILFDSSEKYAEDCRSQEIESEADAYAFYDSVGWGNDSPLVNIWVVETKESRLARDCAASAASVETNRISQRNVPYCSRPEFQPPRLMRGLEVTLSPRLLPIPAVRSSHRLN